MSGLLRGRLRRQLGSQPLLSLSQNDDRGCEEISPLVPQATYDALSHSLLTQRTSLPLQPLQRYVKPGRREFSRCFLSSLTAALA
jgi:hypothetical protein